MITFFRFFFIFSLAFWPFADEPQDYQEPPILESSLELPENREEAVFIRVLLLKKVKEFRIETPSAFKVVDALKREIFRADHLVESKVNLTPDGMKIGEHVFIGKYLKLISLGEGFKIAGREYRGNMMVIKDKSNLLMLVNHVHVDDYLKGVLPWEANPRWKLESLKAQAIASRTYAIFKEIENKQRNYSVTSDVLSQVYKGKSTEKPQTDRAVDDTAGMIVTYQGQVFPAYFHSTCGGATTRAETNWRIKPHPSLEGVTCGHCEASKHYAWETEILKEDIETVLRKNQIAVSELISIIPILFDESDRATRFELVDTQGVFQVQANDFRLWVGPFKLKSTLIESIDTTESGFRFKGRGWGHGSGICQYGLKRLGELGKSFDRILTYYYPNSEIVHYYE